MLIELEIGEKEHSIIISICEKKDMSPEELLQELFSKAIESYLEDLLSI